MQLIPSIDLSAGRSRLVFWPGASTGRGTPTDRPEQIARHFVSLGAPLLHLVDLDGAARGVPANVTAVTAISREVAVPLQLAGGVDGPEQIELAFAAGATRVVIPAWSVAEDAERLRACVRAAGDWLAVGLDARSERLRDYPWRGQPRTMAELIDHFAAEDVRRMVISHWTPAELPEIAALVRGHDIELELAGGVSGPALLSVARAAGAAAVIIGEPLFTGAIDYVAAAADMASPAMATHG